MGSAAHAAEAAAAADPIAMALEVARAALATVEPAEDTATARINRQLARDSLSSLERGLRFMAWEKNRQAQVAADRAARAQVDQAFQKPAAQQQPQKRT